MNTILEKIYYEWLEDSEETKEVKEAYREIEKFNDLLKNSLKKEDFFKLDDAIVEHFSVGQKQGFMAGFEICKKLLLGGK